MNSVSLFREFARTCDLPREHWRFCDSRFFVTSRESARKRSFRVPSRPVEVRGWCRLAVRFKNTMGLGERGFLLKGRFAWWCGVVARFRACRAREETEIIGGSLHQTPCSLASKHVDVVRALWLGLRRRWLFGFRSHRPIHGETSRGAFFCFNTFLWWVCLKWGKKCNIN